MKQKYTGGCQCGNVRYEVQAEIGRVISCNCSRCAKLGSLLSAAQASDFKLLSGEGDLTTFKFNKHVIDHPFCSTCGIQSFASGKGQDGSDMVMINVRCLDGVDPDQVQIMKFDGRSM
jgi:hypothetical protein